MSHAEGLQPAGVDCGCVATHSPPSVLLEHHHVWPQEFGGPTVPDNLVWICASTHNSVHVFLRLFAAAKRSLSVDELRAALTAGGYPAYVNRYTYRLAVRGWVAIQTGTVQP